jgi:catechol 2,3-dioxygenase-like lactoylglutathione lyase family enzyme
MLEYSLYVDDLERSVKFYRDLFGLEVIDAGDRLIALSVPGPQILLLCRKGASAHLPVPHDGSGQQHLAFAIGAQELDAWQSRLKDAGIPIDEVRHWTRGGTSLYFRDPDGHLLELATPGVWSTY